jgi:hypothetical protein
MLMGFRRWAGQDRGHYYSISVPFIVLVLTCGGLLALLLPASYWLLTLFGW